LRGSAYPRRHGEACRILGHLMLPSPRRRGGAALPARHPAALHDRAGGPGLDALLTWEPSRRWADRRGTPIFPRVETPADDAAERGTSPEPHRAPAHLAGLSTRIATCRTQPSTPIAKPSSSEPCSGMTRSWCWATTWPRLATRSPWRRRIPGCRSAVGCIPTRGDTRPVRLGRAGDPGRRPAGGGGRRDRARLPPQPRARAAQQAALARQLAIRQQSASRCWSTTVMPTMRRGRHCWPGRGPPQSAARSACTASRGTWPGDRSRRRRLPDQLRAAVTFSSAHGPAPPPRRSPSTYLVETDSPWLAPGVPALATSRSPRCASPQSCAAARNDAGGHHGRRLRRVPQADRPPFLQSASGGGTVA